MLYNRKEKIEKICLNCKKKFKLLPSRVKRRKFCSMECSNNYQLGKKRIGNYKSNSGSFKKGNKSWIKGKKTPFQAREKQRQAKLKNPVKYWLGKERPEMRKPLKDKSNWNEFRMQIMERTEYKSWRRKVFERDNYTCQNCGIKNGLGKSVRLNAHHIKRVKDNLDLIYDLDNGVTLCFDCHLWLDTIKF